MFSMLLLANVTIILQHTREVSCVYYIEATDMTCINTCVV